MAHHHQQPPEFKVLLASTAGSIDHDHNQQLASTWVERLLLNLLSYSIVILPIAFTVIATKRRLLPRSIRTNSLVQRFVFGSSEAGLDHAFKLEARNGSEGRKRLLDSRDTQDRPPPKRSPTQQSTDVRSSALEFIGCLLGLQVSYLIWGILQEKIMTTSYPTTNGSSSSNLKSTLDTETNRTSSSTQDLKQQSQHYLHGDQDGIVTFHDSQFLVFINRLVAFLTAMLALLYTQLRQGRLYANRIYANGLTSSRLVHNIASNAGSKPNVPLYKYIYCSMSNILSSWSQYEALKYVNFPTQCLSKSCKVIPVMLMSRLMLRQRHPSSDYLCALLLALGMFTFMFNQPVSLPQHHHSLPNPHHRDPAPATGQELGSNSGLWSGLIILSIYLTFDSFTSNWQQSLYSQYDISNWQMMAATNFYSLLLTLTSLAQLGNLRPTFRMLASSSSLMSNCLAMSVMSSIGQVFVYYTIKRFGSVLFAVIMTIRQFLSILMSILIFGHQITFNSLIGLALVFMVAGYQVYHKSQKRRQGSKRIAHSLSNSNPNGNLIKPAAAPSDGFSTSANDKKHAKESVFIDIKK